MIRSTGTLGPNQLAECRDRWPAFRDLERRSTQARAETIRSYDATRPGGIRLALRRLDWIEQQVAA
ncbi:hypothetical protein FRZ44_38410 [Hypericibacter terrae]|uniref:Uncharacterized protein n=1 Tax=Hypericibacter terrae TaxID=2602015 RepID=A0A5J6MM52_9PROT|nr:hypothetical protein [Hypericibacter terrae]QEX18534.1 hypothetical protein FRZ44_38410 [Hypericibacter terrae]